MYQIAFVFSFLLCIHISCIAQETRPNRLLDSLKQQSHIPWIGTVTIDYQINHTQWDNNYLKSIKKEKFANKEVSQVLKYQVSAYRNPLSPQDYQLRQKILAAVDTPYAINAYRTAALDSVYSAAAIQQIINPRDTIIAIDPVLVEAGVNDFMEIKTIPLRPDAIKGFRLKQLIYYDSQHLMFKTIPLAIAPIITVHNQGGQPQASKPLFWLKPTVANKAPDLNASSVRWAKRILRFIPISTIKIIYQQDSFTTVIEKMLKNIRRNATQLKIYPTPNGNSPISTAQTSTIGASTDTILSIDPETFDEKTEIVERIIKGKDIEGLLLIQDWFWDNKLIKIRSLGFAPLHNRYDDNGNYFYSKLIFTRRIEEDK